jgi:hypothetical protein
MKTSFTTSLVFLLASAGVAAQAPAPAVPGPFKAGTPLATVNEAGVPTPMSGNVKVFGSFNFSESCTFDPARNVIVAMNAGAAQEILPNDGYVSLINPDGSVHTSKWIGATRDSLTLNHPRGSAISNGVLYTVDEGVLRSFDLVTGNPLKEVTVTGGTFLNGIGVTADGTAYISNTRAPETILKVTPDGTTSVFLEGAPLAAPNGVAIDKAGNIVVVNIGTNDVLTFNPAGELIRRREWQRWFGNHRRRHQICEQCTFWQCVAHSRRPGCRNHCLGHSERSVHVLRLGAEATCHPDEPQ